MLSLKKIKKSYKTGDFTQDALKGVSIDFRPNEFVAILGPSGSGKTTLLNIIGGLDRYDSGNLIINNKSTEKFKDANWDAYRNNCVGFIFQNYNLITHISVLDNIEMGMTLSGVPPKKRREKALEVLKKVGLLDHAHKKPNQLSGGQMQRVAIARALANNPDIILADEPTGALDSSTSVQIMELIKDISKNKLVIMVTHNPELAKKYANRIIELKDGELISDSNPTNGLNSKKEKFNIKKTAMNFLTALKLSFNNIKTKKGRTLLTAFASSIGIIGIALILSLSNGFNIQIEKFESDTLSSLPIGIIPTVPNIDINEMQNNEMNILYNRSDKLYPDVDVIYPYDASENLKSHINVITDDYINYLEKVDAKLISAISYYRLTNLNLLLKTNDKIRPINSSSINLMSMPKELTKENYIKSNYDLIKGEYPKNKTDIVLIIDSQNRVDTTLLEALGLDSSKKEIKFEELIGIKFKLIDNDNYYISLGNDMYTYNTDYEKLYNNENNIELTITGIIRGKEDNKLASIMTLMSENMGMNYVSTLGYSDELAEEIVKRNQTSKIVESQKRSDGIVYMGGLAFESAGATKDQILTMLGADAKPVMINIFPKDFDTKDQVLEYLDGYNKGKKEENQVIYLDYAKEMADLSSSIMDAITIVLIAFSAISLVVSSIMIGIITYISVLERTKEIGILRSLGARKKDIRRVFNAETFLIGISSGLLGILIAWLLTFPANQIIYDLTNLNNVAKLNPLHALLLITVSVILTIIGGYIPARIASKKDPVEALRTE